MYDALGSWRVGYESCLGVPDYISWKDLQMSYCSAASPQLAVPQSGKLTWQCHTAERRGGLCLFPVPCSWLFSRCDQRLPTPALTGSYRSPFCASSTYSASRKLFLLKKVTSGQWIFFHRRWAVGSACCGHETVVSVTLLPDPRLTAAPCRIAQESPGRRRAANALFVSQWTLWNVKLCTVAEEKSLSGFLNTDWPRLWGKER